MLFSHLLPPTPSSTQQAVHQCKSLHKIKASSATWAGIRSVSASYSPKCLSGSLPSTLTSMRSMVDKQSHRSSQGNLSNYPYWLIQPFLYKYDWDSQRHQLFKENQEHKRKGSGRTTEQLMPKHNKQNWNRTKEITFFKYYYCFLGDLREYCTLTQ